MSQITQLVRDSNIQNKTGIADVENGFEDTGGGRVSWDKVRE